MRITIELDQNDSSRPVTAVEGQPQATSDAGGPPDRLLAELGEGTQSGDAAGLTEAGAPPSWLVQAVEAARMSEPESSGESSDTNAADGGAAPSGE